MNYFVHLFLFTILMSYSFRISGWFTVNTILIIFMIIIYLLNGLYKRNLKLGFIKEDIVFGLFMLVVFLGVLVNDYNSKHFTHTLSFIFVGIAYFYFLRIILYNYNFNYKFIFLFLSAGMILSNAVLILEFYARNYNQSILFLIDFFQLGNARDYLPTFKGDIFRARGFSIESGHTALAYNAIAPIVLGYFWSFKRKYFFPFLIFTLIAYLTLISAGGIGSIIVGILFVTVFWSFSNINIILSNIKIILLPIFIFLLVLLLFSFQNQSLAISLIIDKLLFINDSGRFERWSVATTEISKMDSIQIFFGWGLGHMAYLYNFDGVNLYLKLFTETGLLGLFLFILIIFMMFIRILKIKSNFKYFLMISFISVCAQYFVISDYAYPWLWLVFSFIVLSSKPRFYNFLNK